MAAGKEARMAEAVAYVADVSSVKEVSLLGTVDLELCRATLQDQGLSPVEGDGRARMVVSATDARFHGIRFREWTCGLFVRPPDGSPFAEGLYLIHAFNSLRLFAWIERNCFSTPYYHGTIEAQPSLPAGIRLSVGKRLVFEAAMSSRHLARQSSDSLTQTWSGPIFLPRQPGDHGPGKWFQALLAGETQSHAFMAEDRLTLDASSSDLFMRWL
ncbi:MAG: hypothetical protein AB7O62_26560, partial [Pirellulales bacterium]